jgi:hypothetical protein
MEEAKPSIIFLAVHDSLNQYELLQARYGKVRVGFLGTAACLAKPQGP